MIITRRRCPSWVGENQRRRHRRRRRRRRVHYTHNNSQKPLLPSRPLDVLKRFIISLSNGLFFSSRFFFIYIIYMPNRVVTRTAPSQQYYCTYITKLLPAAYLLGRLVGGGGGGNFLIKYNADEWGFYWDIHFYPPHHRIVIITSLQPLLFGIYPFHSLSLNCPARGRIGILNRPGKTNMQRP